MKITTPIFRTTLKELPDFTKAVKTGLKESGFSHVKVESKIVFSNTGGTLATIEVSRKGLDNPKVYQATMHAMFRKIFGLESIPNVY